MLPDRVLVLAIAWCFVPNSLHRYDVQFTHENDNENEKYVYKGILWERQLVKQIEFPISGDETPASSTRLGKSSNNG